VSFYKIVGSFSFIFPILCSHGPFGIPVMSLALPEIILYTQFVLPLSCFEHVLSGVQVDFSDVCGTYLLFHKKYP
jgi:hypothetical protein